MIEIISLIPMGGIDPGNLGIFLNLLAGLCV